MTDDELLAAVGHFSELCRQDSDVALMRTIILSKGHESIGHFCRADPEGFADLYEAALGMAVGLEREMERFVELRGTKTPRPEEG